MAPLTSWELLLAVAVTLVASVVKGAVGFALPIIMVSGLALFLPAPVALAMLILPTLSGNLWQALRQGRAAAWASRSCQRTPWGRIPRARGWPYCRWRACPSAASGVWCTARGAYSALRRRLFWRPCGRLPLG